MVMVMIRMDDVTLQLSSTGAQHILTVGIMRAQARLAAWDVLGKFDEVPAEFRNLE